jgi:hypothetical protein
VKNLVPILALFIALAGCTGDDPFGLDPDPECDLTPPTITTNSPVTAGTDIVLETSYVNNGIYNWSGPNGFVSHEQNPVINIASPAMAGTYSLSVGNGVDGCVTHIATETVVVLPAVAPCNPVNNTVTTSVFPDISLYSINVSTVADFYEINASGSGGDLTITFKDETQPTAGMYSICQDCPTSFLEANQVCVSMVAGGSFSYYYVAQSGFVYISYIGNKISATFCDVPFAGAGTNITFTGSAKITEE